MCEKKVEKGECILGVLSQTWR